jgi:hypothetical protein
MLKKILILFVILQFLFINTYAESSKKIEIYNIEKNKLMKTIENNKQWNTEAKQILKNITGVYVKFNPIPKSGIVIKIPIEPSVMVKGALIDEVNVILPEDDRAYMMIYDDENAPFFYNSQIDEKRIRNLIKQ